MPTAQHRFGLGLGTWEVVLAGIMVDSSCSYTLAASQMSDFQKDTLGRRTLNKVRQWRIRQRNSKKLEWHRSASSKFQGCVTIGFLPIECSKIYS